MSFADHNFLNITPVRCGAAQADGEEQVIVIDHAIAVAVEVGEVLDSLNVP